MIKHFAIIFSLEPWTLKNRTKWKHVGTTVHFCTSSTLHLYNYHIKKTWEIVFSIILLIYVQLLYSRTYADQNQSVWRNSDHP